MHLRHRKQPLRHGHGGDARFGADRLFPARPFVRHSDPAKYRSKDELQKMRSEHDPIEQVRERLLANKWATEDDLKAIDKEVRDIVADSADFAQSDPEPDVSELWTDILA